MKLTRDTIYKIYKTIKELDSRKYNKYFLLACSNNKKILEPFVESIEIEANKTYIPEVITFQKEYENMINEYQITPSEELANKIKIFVDKNKQIIDNHKTRDAEFSNWINEYVEIELKEIAFEHVPDELEKSVFDSLVVLFKVD